MLAPPYVAADRFEGQLAALGHAVVSPSTVQRAFGVAAVELGSLPSYWNDLPADTYLKDGGRYRFRRHSCFVADGDELTQAPHRAHWQPLDYNALHGGIERMFEPLAPAMTALPAWRGLLLGLAGVASALKGAQPWFIEAHAFRIDTASGIGRPTPEGAHRDGVDLVAVFMVDRHGIKGGESRVFEAQGPNGLRFTMSEPWSLLLLDDERVIHETTPIQPEGAVPGHRDTLVLTLRAGGFQGP
ncbi:MAG: 2OG-Fe dioxygenase family protein [Paucibacter sp.]|nr:2OG-Fe dioxygenase family protein [Roseateles sp.]